MDIEHIICIDYLLKDSKIIPDIEKIIYSYLGLPGGYNKIIDDHINNERILSQLLSIKLNNEFHIRDHITTELCYILDHQLHIYHPEFVNITYNHIYYPDFINITYHCWVWELLDPPLCCILDYDSKGEVYI